MKETTSNLRPFSNIAVVGGTPFDSGKGANYLWKHHIKSQAIGISARPSQQAELYNNPSIVEKKFEDKAGGEEFSEIIIYCNSLSFITDWQALYPGRIFELTTYYRSIFDSAQLDKLAIIVAEENTVNNLKKMVDREDICNSKNLNIFPSLNLINRLESCNEEDQLKLLTQTLEAYAKKGFEEILLGCTHLDHPEFSNIRDLKVYQPGLTMLNEFIARYNSSQHL